MKPKKNTQFIGICKIELQISLRLVDYTNIKYVIIELSKYKTGFV